MSIKKLFEDPRKSKNFLAETTKKTSFDDAESADNIMQKKHDHERYVPQVDYSDPVNFAKYGSARLYYESAFTRILDFYPYDGSEAEINKFHNEALDIEEYIFDNLYPRTNGFITLARDGYSVSEIVDGYGTPTTNEYIDFKGGPGTGSATSLKLKDLMPNPKNSSYKNSNIYDETIYQTEGLPSDYGSGTRTSNLRANLDNGVTVEFWLQTGSFDPGVTDKQVIFDLWNQNATTADDYGRITIELTSSLSDLTESQRPFVITVQSGSHTAREFFTLGSSSIHVNLSDWNHYAITMCNTGSNFKTELYVNGQYHDKAIRSAYDISTTNPQSARGWPHAEEEHYTSSAGLQGWWKLDTANDYADSSGNGRDGTVSASPPFVPTHNSSQTPSLYVAAGSHTFDGANDSVIIGDAEIWNAIIGTDIDGGSTEKMTLSAWIRPLSDGEGDAGRIIDFGAQDVALFIADESGTTARIYYTVKFTASSSSTAVWRTTNREITLSQWNHVAVSFDTTSVSNDPVIYINGVAVDVTETTTPAGHYGGIESATCRIGNMAGSDRTFDGQIADVAVWNSILRPAEIRSIYSAASLTSATTYSVGELEPRETIGRIGALQTSHPSSTAATGSGRLSGSLDEFRYWKTKRTAKQIGRNWLTQVRGGSNTDISNATLGVYYKFNEGITGHSATDSIVLDYAGRVTNGVWTGYSSDARNTGSAIVLSNAATKEFLDPIIRTNHPDVIDLKSELISTGSSHDFNNNAALISLVPGWIQDEEAENENSDLRYMAHIMGTYFDKLYLQISELPKLRHLNYLSASSKPFPFAHHLPQSLGLYSPELFIDSTILEKFINRNEDTVFESELNDTKNLIYQNLYNNLTDIFKSKGTEQSIRNVFRCFNIGDNVLSININSNNEEFLLKNNLKLNLLKKNVVDFSKLENNNAVIYQASASFDGMSNSDASGSIDGAEEQIPYGLTYESNIIFPDYKQHIGSLTRDKNYNQISLFGMVTVGTTTAKKEGTDTTFESSGDAGTDVCNFRVYAIRDEEGSKNVYFQLTSSFPEAEFAADGDGADIAGINLTSSVYLDVYNDEPWNFSIRLKPKTYPLSTFVVTGSDTSGVTPNETYEVVFTGINAKTADVRDMFVLSQSVPNSTAKAMIQARKRIFVGADRTNLTGDVQFKSDVQVSSVAYWGKYLNDSDLIQHAVDFENIGVSDNQSFLSPLDTNADRRDVLNRDTLILNWNFRNVTGSDADGRFVVQDFSSGSSDRRTKFGWLGRLSGRKYTGLGHDFKKASTEVVTKKSINTYKFINPESAVSSDMIQLFSEEDEFFPDLRREEFIPNHVYTVEKSLYNAVSEEMLDFMAGVNDFHNLIGHPVNRYRERYKGMEKLRQSFFRRVKKVSDVEKYINYYKWFDDAITSIISQLIPASAEYVDDIQNVIESHVLERNKYKTKLNILETKAGAFDNLEAVPGILGDSPWVDLPEDEDSPLGDFIVVKGSPNRGTGTIIIDPVTGEEMPRTDPRHPGFAAPLVTGEADHPRDSPIRPASAVKGGVNFHPSKNLDFSQTRLRPAGPVSKEDSVFVPLNVMIGFTAESVVPKDIPSVARPPEYITKDRKVFHVQQGKDWELGIGYKNAKSNMVLPFNVVSSNVEVNTGYNKQVVDKVGRNLQITNLHNDAYGRMIEVPMQGPFTQHAVGGHQSRHVALNKGSDTQITRPEAWRIRLGTCADLREGDGTPNYTLDRGTPQTGAVGLVGPDYPPPEYNPPRGTIPYPYNAFQKAYLYRDEFAKRPVNIRNIRYASGAASLGNYRHNYEVVHSFGAYNNPRAFIDNQPSLPSVAFQSNTTSSTSIRTVLSTRRGEQEHFNFIDDYDTSYLTGTTNKSIIVTRFSAPGGIEVQTRGYQDFRASEFSVYNCFNYRNLSVKKPSQGPSGTFSEPHGGTPSTSRVFDIHGKDYGFYSHVARHTARFGRDSLHVTSSDNLPGAKYDQLPGFHKIHRNRKQVIVATDESNSTFITSSKFDNFNVIHPIPRSDRQYRWINNSVTDIDSIIYTGYQKTQAHFAPAMGPFRTSSAGKESYWNFVTQSDAVSGNLYQPANRLNVLVVDPVNRKTNTFGHPAGTVMSNYANEDLVGPLGVEANTNYLNQLLCKRKAVYGWGWNKFHQADNKAFVEQRKANELVLAKGAKKVLNTYRLTPVSMKGRQFIVNFDIPTPNGVHNLTLKSTNTNEKIFFSENELNKVTEKGLNLAQRTPANDLLSVALSNNNSFNWFIYIQNIFPSMRNEFVSHSAKRLGYDNLYWRDDNSNRITVGNTVLNSFGVSVSQSSWPLDPPVDFLTRTSITVGRGDETASLQTFNITETQAGELQNTYGSYFTINSDGNKHTYAKPAALYARKHCLGSPRSVVSPSGQAIAETGSFTGSFTEAEQIETLAGEAVWQAASQAGVVEKLKTNSVFVPSASNPWWNNYDDFREDLRLKAKGYSVVPEFRMSEHVNEYYKYGTINKSLKDTFEIPGTQFSSSQTDFYKDFSNTDFLQEFLGIEQNKLLSAKEIRLRCIAAIRYNAYKGFYPVQRTTDLVSQFYNSFSSALQVNYVDGNGISQALTNKNNSLRDNHGGTIKLVYDKLFSPGILYNSIKSGLAVDYPIVTDPSTMNRVHFGPDPFRDAFALSIDAVTSSATDGEGYDGGIYWDKRIPFEGIINPKKHLPGTSFFDMESHPSMSLDSFSVQGPPIRTPVFTASMNENGDEIYSLMARNFFGECSNFFLKNNELSKLESQTVTDDLKFKKGEVYMARIKLRRSHNGDRTYQHDVDSGNISGSTSNYALDGARVVNQFGVTKKQSFPIPQDPSRHPTFKETFTMYSRPSAFGPPIAGRPSGSRATSGSFEYAAKDSFEGYNSAFTPPYYDGESWVDLVFRPTASVPYDLERILSETQVKCWRFDPGHKIFAEDSPATATFTFSDKPNEDTTITLTDAAKTVVTFVIDDAADSNVSGTKVTQIQENGAGATGTAIALVAAINASSLNITATRDGNKVVLTQDTAGVAGNTTITSTLTNSALSVAVPSAFTGGFDGTARADIPSLIPVERMSDNPDYEGDSPSNDLTIPSIYDGYRINKNSMHLTSSVDIFGVERVLDQAVDKFGNVIETRNKTVGAKWIIQTKWETPMLNFSDEGVRPITAASGTLSLPTYGAASVPRGMWHQFGVIPDDQKTGVFLEIGDIPEQWLKNHYDVLNNESIYNNFSVVTGSSKETTSLHKRVKSLTNLCGFNKTNTSTKIGQIKDKMIVSEAVIAVPYILEEIECFVDDLSSESTIKKRSKKFISIPKRRFEAAMKENTGTSQGDSLNTAGESIRKLKQAMEKYVFPPQFDFLNNKSVKPVAMYVFEFDYEFDKDDLSYIWQNIAPRDYQKMHFKSSVVSHNLANNEFINENILSEKNLRWMVFKVKQRAQKDYYDLITDQVGESTGKIVQEEFKEKDYQVGFNWPYDYLSFVELIKMDVDVLVKKQ